MRSTSLFPGTPATLAGAAGGVSGTTTVVVVTNFPVPATLTAATRTKYSAPTVRFSRVADVSVEAS